MHDRRYAADENQEAAIRHGTGPCAVVAGPGSGKTHVIVERIRNLILEYGVSPSSILVLTFSRAAAAQMRSRFLKRGTEGRHAGKLRAAREGLSDLAACPAFQDVVFGTFHAFFYRILQESGHEKLRLVETRTRRGYLEHLCRVRPELDSGTGQSPAGGREAKEGLCRIPEGMTPEGLQLLISRYKNGLSCQEPWVSALVQVYDGYLGSRGCLDFDDMILRCHSLLARDPAVLAQWRDRFPFILVDEFQDVSPLQYEVLRLLAAPGNNLFVVGDDDQSIYGFRGADPATMQRFLREFSGGPAQGGRLRTVFLSTNYRCDRAICHAASALIRANRDRIPKHFRTGSARTGRFLCRPFSTRQEEYACIAGELQGLEPAGRADTAVIFRTHMGAEGFLSVLRSRGIPFTAQGMQKSIGKRTAKEEILGDLITWYRTAEALGRGSADREDLFRIMNQPERYLSGSFVTARRVSAEGLMAHAGFERETVRGLLDDLELLEALSPAYSLRYLLDSAGYRGYAEEAYAEGMQPGGIRALLDALCTEAKEVPDAFSWRRLLEARLGSLREADGEADGGYAGAGGGHPVRVLTMHACKGLEFDRVYIPDLNEGNVPSRRAWTQGQIEEERRLLYVAMTRARHRLTLTYLEGTRDAPAAPSRFLYPFLHGV